MRESVIGSESVGIGSRPISPGAESVGFGRGPYRPPPIPIRQGDSRTGKGSARRRAPLASQSIHRTSKTAERFPTHSPAPGVVSFSLAGPPVGLFFLVFRGVS
jgi:hypothetical protein